MGVSLGYTQDAVEGDDRVKFRRPKDKRDLLLAYIAVRFSLASELLRLNPPCEFQQSIIHARGVNHQLCGFFLNIPPQVAALIVDGYTMESTDLAAELRLDVLTLNKTFQMLGCNPIRRVGTTEAGQGIYRVQLLQQGAVGDATAAAGDAGAQKLTLGELLPVMKMRVQPKAKK